MCCCRGCKFDSAQVLEFLQIADNVSVPAVEPAVVYFGEPIEVEARQTKSDGIGCFAALRKACLVFFSSRDAAVKILFETFFEMLVAELFSKNWRDSEGDFRGYAVVPEVADGVEERNVCLEHALVDAFLTEWPHPCFPIIRKVAVKHEYKGTDAHESKSSL